MDLPRLYFTQREHFCTVELSSFLFRANLFDKSQSPETFTNVNENAFFGSERLIYSKHAYLVETDPINKDFPFTECSREMSPSTLYVATYQPLAA